MRGQLRPKGPSNVKPDLIARIIRPLLPPRNSLVDVIQQVVLVMYAELGTHAGDAGFGRAVRSVERLSEARGVLGVDGEPIPHLYGAGELGGICGKIVVRVTYADGTIQDVEVLEQNETPEFGGAALEGPPEMQALL